MVYGVEGKEGRGKGETKRVKSRGACDKGGEEHEGGAEIHSFGEKMRIGVCIDFWVVFWNVAWMERWLGRKGGC